MKADIQSLRTSIGPQFSLIDCSHNSSAETLKLYPEKNEYRVYIMTRDDNAIILGHGRWDRAKVIFDDLSKYTATHCKSGLLRLYNLYDLSLTTKPSIGRYMILCENKVQAEKLEHELQRKFGGNVSEVPQYLFDFILRNYSKGSPEWLLVMMAFQSNFSPLTDLCKWRRKGLILDNVWKNLVDLLYLKE